MNCASATMPGVAQELDRLLVLRGGGFLVEAVELQLRRGFGAQRHVDQPGLAVEGQQLLVAQDVGHAGVDAPQDGELALDEFLAEGDELLAVDGGLLVGEDEEADLVVAHQGLDLVDHLLRVADAIVAPELPLAAEAAGERAAAGEVGDGDAHAHRDVDVLGPLEDAPVGGDAVEVLDRRFGRRRDDLAVVEVGHALDGLAVGVPRAVVDGLHEIEEHLLAFAAHHGVDPGRFGQHLRVHERPVDAAQHRHDVSVYFLGNPQQAFGLVDRRGDRGAADDVRLDLRDLRPDRVVVEVMGHRIDEGDVVIAAGLEVAGEVRDPGGRPVARDLGAAGVVVRMQEQDAHGGSPQRVDRTSTLGPATGRRFEVCQETWTNASQSKLTLRQPPAAARSLLQSPA